MMFNVCKEYITFLFSVPREREKEKTRQTTSILSSVFIFEKFLFSL